MTPPALPPRVRRNEWQSLEVPALDTWTPTLAVSVVIPAYDAGRLLPYVLAGLAAQTYPAHLLEVVVAGDGPGDLALPEVRPDNTRVVAVEHGWGRANACHTGALAAEGDVLHWYDADMLAERHEVEAQARWHHALDHAVVLGDKWFVDPAPVLARSPTEVRDAVAGDRVAAYFAGQERVPHTWVEEIYVRTDLLRQAGWFAIRTHTGATASVRRELYLDSGGFDTSLRLGEDIALGARLGAAGAVFVPERAAVSWHLGPTQVMGRRDQVNAYNDPFLADGSAVLRAKRHPGRTYTAPYAEVVLDVRGHDPLDVTATVDSVLAGTLHDLVVTLLGDWHTLSDARAAVLDDPSLPTRVVHATYAGDARVRFAAEVGPRDAAFRVVLPAAAWAPRRPALEKLLLHLEHTHDGLRLIGLDDGSVVRIERTAAFARARRLVGSGASDDRPSDHLDAIVGEIAGTGTLAAGRAGFAPSHKVRPRPYPRTGGPPVGPADAWARVEKTFEER